MYRLLILACATLACACSTVHSNIPDKPTKQIRKDYNCNEITGTLVGRVENWETYDVIACGQQLRISCPFGAHSRWRRCRYEEPTAGGVGTIQVVEQGSAPTPEAEAQLRAQIDQQKTPILACTGNAPATIALTWDANAATASVSLASAPGTPADECVRTALGSLALPAGTAGTIQHVVSP